MVFIGSFFGMFIFFHSTSYAANVNLVKTIHPYELISVEATNKLKAIRDNYGEISHLDKKYQNKVHKNSLPYHLYIPHELDKNKKYPLVVFLHGYSDLTIDTHKGFPKGVWSLPLVQNKYPHILFVPRYRTFDDMWENNDYYEMVMEALDDLQMGLQSNPNEPQIDKTRIYLTGFSQGGKGTWSYLIRQPNKFAAAAPLSGYFNGPQSVKHAKKIKHIPLWIFNGDSDAGVNGSRLSYQFLKLAKANDVTYHEYQKQGHVIDDFAYFTDGFFDWLFAQKLATPKPSSNK